MNRIDLQALTLAGPTGKNPVPDPLGVLHLDKQLFMKYFMKDGECHGYTIILHVMK